MLRAKARTSTSTRKKYEKNYKKQLISELCSLHKRSVV